MHVSEIEIITSVGGMCGKLRSPTSDLNIDHCEDDSDQQTLGKMFNSFVVI